MPKYLHTKYQTIDKGFLTPCYIWQGCLRSGYGMITNPNYDGTNGKMMQAHVFYYEQKHGKVPTGLVVDHLCDQRACVNVEHLEAKTHAANIRRGKVPLLNEAAVADIRMMLAEGILQQGEIAKMYGVSHSTLSQIARNVTWK